MNGRLRVILKNGASFEFDAIDPTVTKDRLERLGKLDWTRPEDWETDVLYLQRRDVAAVIVIRGPEESSPESPPSPKG